MKKECRRRLTIMMRASPIIYIYNGIMVIYIMVNATAAACIHIHIYI